MALPKTLFSSVFFDHTSSSQHSFPFDSYLPIATALYHKGFQSLFLYFPFGFPTPPPFSTPVPRIHFSAIVILSRFPICTINWASLSLSFVFLITHLISCYTSLSYMNIKFLALPWGPVVSSGPIHCSWFFPMV